MVPVLALESFSLQEVGQLQAILGEPVVVEQSLPIESYLLDPVFHLPNDLVLSSACHGVVLAAQSGPQVSDAQTPAYGVLGHGVSQVLVVHGCVGLRPVHLEACPRDRGVPAEGD